MMAEARLLRQHKGRLEARMHILEEHNRQLEAQLQRLRRLLDEVRHHKRNKFTDLQNIVKRRSLLTDIFNDINLYSYRQNKSFLLLFKNIRESFCRALENNC